MSTVPSHPRSSAIGFDGEPSGIPEELRTRNQWVVWRYELTLDRSNYTKVPYRADNPERGASTTNPETWATFDEASERYRRRLNRNDFGRLDGIGYVFAQDDPFVGIDLDRCLSATGEVLPWAAGFLASLQTYAEVSPSGRGVKLVARAKLPGDGHRKNNVGPDGAAVECYDWGRFFTITGRRFGSHPTEICDLTQEVNTFYAALWPEKEADEGKRPVVARVPLNLTDQQILARAFESRSGAKIRRMFSGDTSDFGGDESSADQALCCHLAFWFQRDAAAIDRVFRTSGLMRPKWDDRRRGTTYGAGTIAKAIDWTAEVYSPPQDVVIVVGGRRVNLGKGAADDAEPELEAVGPPENVDDPYRIARVFVQNSCDSEGIPTVCFWCDEWYAWNDYRYVQVSESELKADVTGLCKREFDAAAEATGRSPVKVSRTVVNNVLGCVQSMTLIRQSQCPAPPAWVGPECDDLPDPVEILPARNGLVHLPTLVDGGREGYMFRPSPRFFSPNCLDYDFEPDATRPSAWLDFLESLWGDDRESINCLQEWLGYLLIPDTRQQKILAIIGPPRSGKGTIAKVITALVGQVNVASPTLSSMASNFGVAPLIGKTVAIFPDARLSGRQDAQVVVERLLSISGEDDQTIDRKHLPSWTGRLKTRFVLLSNELPRLGDSSGAITSRTVILKLTRSFLGAEDPELQPKLMAELPSILVWAIVGWARLRKRGRFVQPASGQELLDELQELASPITTFVEECCVLGPDESATVDELFKAWATFCQGRGREHVGDQQGLGRMLRAAVPSLKKHRPREGEKRVRAYMGIGLRADF